MTEPVRPNELQAFFAYVIDVLERLDIPYMVVGGFAAIFYGEPRLTLDVDIVVDMKPVHVRPFVAAFPIPDYYVSIVKEYYGQPGLDPHRSRGPIL